MTVGQKEKITYRGKLVRVNRSNEFLPAQGIGAGLSEGLGIVLNRVIRGTPSYRNTTRVLRATGTMVEETAEYVTLELKSGRRLRIRVADIVRRKSVR